MGRPIGEVADVVRFIKTYSDVVATQRESPFLLATTLPEGMGTSCRDSGARW